MKFKGTLTFEYEIDTENATYDYGTDDRQKMAQIDKQEIEKHGLGTIELIADDWSVSIEPME